jgi:uncharacterized repeat protein (TIGR03803 family)
MTKLSASTTICLVLLFCAATTIRSSAQFNTLANFNEDNGADPRYMSLVQGVDGSFYGTTGGGGDLSCGTSGGCGTIFKITLDGTLTTLHTFNGFDGSEPYPSLLLGTDGNFYGTTYIGEGPSAYGTIFSISTSGDFGTLYEFCFQAGCADGSGPLGALVQGEDGTLYGTTAFGGTANDGTVFKRTKSGVFTTLHSFDNTDGSIPSAGLVQATNSNFYGITSYGGPNNGDGTVFKITPEGTLTTLHTFNGADGGGLPYGAALVQATDGNFYGTTSIAGTHRVGTVFKMTPAGVTTILYNFCSQKNCEDGDTPYSGLIQGTDGLLYGTTSSGGSPSNDGTVFSLSRSTGLTTLHSFTGSDGIGPWGALLQATNGNFYGSTVIGGLNNFGTLFTISTGLGPFVAFVRNPAKSGQTFGILGQGFTGTSSVSLNGIPASFTVESDTFIKATVPVGATSGYVTVTTPTGVLTSNVPFYVLP